MTSETREPPNAYAVTSRRRRHIRELRRILRRRHGAVAVAGLYPGNSPNAAALLCLANRLAVGIAFALHRGAAIASRLEGSTRAGGGKVVGAGGWRRRVRRRSGRYVPGKDPSQPSVTPINPCRRRPRTRGVGQAMMPRRKPTARACARECTPKAARRLRTCDLAVSSVRQRRFPISAFVSPSAINWSTSSSRFVGCSMSRRGCCNGVTSAPGRRSRGRR